MVNMNLNLSFHQSYQVPGKRDGRKSSDVKEKLRFALDLELVQNSSPDLDSTKQGVGRIHKWTEGKRAGYHVGRCKQLWWS